MQKVTTPVPSVNLAKRQGKFLDTFIHWALTAGRAAVIVTEAIALSAFLYRFSLDRQIIDLHDKINQEQAIVKLLKHNEDTYRNLQSRLALISTLQKQTSDTSKIFFDILHLIPSDIAIDSINYSPDGVKFDIHARSLAALQSAIDNIKNYPRIKSVSIDKIENRISTGTIVVSISSDFANSNIKQ